MTTSENPFRRAYWFGEVDPRPLALFRILFGSVVLLDSLRRLPDVVFFFSDDGYAPRDALPSLAHTWSLFRLVGAPGPVLCLYWAGIVAVLALTLGFWTRIASVAVFLFLASLHLRNPLIAIGPDRVMAVMSFWLMLSDSGGAWSLDRRMGRRLGTTVTSTGLRLLQWQTCLIYFFAAIAKRESWGDGLGLFHLLQVRDCARPLGALLVRWPWLCVALNWLVLATELGVPLLFIPLRPLAPRTTRVVGIAGGLGLFTGILPTMRVGFFPELMIATLALFLPPEGFDRIGALDSTPVRDANRSAVSRWRWAVLGAGVLQLWLIVWSLLSFHFEWPERQFLKREIRQLDLDQSWNMFAKGAPFNASWTGVGLLANGDRPEVLERVAPEVATSEPTEFHWQNFRRLMTLPGERHQRSLFGRYACREFNRTAPEPMQQLELTLHGQAVRDPGAPPSPSGHFKVIYHLPCAGDPEDAEE